MASQESLVLHSFEPRLKFRGLRHNVPFSPAALAIESYALLTGQSVSVVSESFPSCAALGELPATFVDHKRVGGFEIFGLLKARTDLDAERAREQGMDPVDVSHETLGLCAFLKAEMGPIVEEAMFGSKASLQAFSRPLLSGGLPFPAWSPLNALLTSALLWGKERGEGGSEKGWARKARSVIRQSVSALDALREKSSRALGERCCFAYSDNPSSVDVVFYSHFFFILVMTVRPVLLRLCRCGRRSLEVGDARGNTRGRPGGRTVSRLGVRFSLGGGGGLGLSEETLNALLEETEGVIESRPFSASAAFAVLNVLTASELKNICRESGCAPWMWEETAATEEETEAEMERERQTERERETERVMADLLMAAKICSDFEAVIDTKIEPDADVAGMTIRFPNSMGRNREHGRRGRCVIRPLVSSTSFPNLRPPPSLSFSLPSFLENLISFGQEAAQTPPGREWGDPAAASGSTEEQEHAGGTAEMEGHGGQGVPQGFAVSQSRLREMQGNALAIGAALGVMLLVKGL
uniref:Mitochondrial outer membrane transport complex Sam37/metaxin N-terminal domain-containing protein n=1 Tax=Chromera velia CCMP2878 TaxID=1169474 RepID=A0A0G4HAX3_9ALVE|eukprot:Cvel_6093.t1-p1 / transcript=Cvel_6093.t1 / gene=Cvel_6093 / organism=Chromera_velia_CCMP2878 / gene_product=hypothetical protein / transcript_product=hypothetical protein / location=Cvel_scaffold293:71248-79119(+) / protein_length=524 / sequence_SO=supercontig / SO=protein_coding / is_pseudo=false